MAKMKLLGFFLFLFLHVSEAIRVQDIPTCAQGCLGNSTANQTACAVIDIACLCSSGAYVSSLSCCLFNACTSDEQAVAIQFNKQECEAVNETAPDFVGCSPAALASALSNASAEQATKTIATASQSTPAMTTSSSSFSGVSTITGDVVSDAEATQTGKPSTASFAGRPLMTGSCTVPYFALVTGRAGMPVQYPAVGCSDGRPDCCPYDPQGNEVITRCPQDHFTTAGGCCPLGYQLYYTAFDEKTPCYSDAATKYVPASTPTLPGLTLITDHVFSHMFVLVTPAGPQKKFPPSAIALITLSGVLIPVLIFLVRWWVRRRRASRIAEAERVTTYPPVEPALQMSRAPTTHELDSPETGARPAGNAGANWLPIFPGMSPPAYDHNKDREQAAASKPIAPQELPGSTFIHEHHPAFSPVAGTDVPSKLSPSSPPKTPTESVIESERKSPVLSPGTPKAGVQSSPFVSPLASPKLL